MSPTGSKVHMMYQAMVREGAPADKAARIAQGKTGMALRTGMPIKPYRANVKLRGKRGR